MFLARFYLMQLALAASRLYLLAPVGVRWVEGRAGLHAAGRGAGRPTSTEQVACGSRGLGFIYCGNKQGREKTVRTQTLSAAARDR